jgi:methylthioribose-1-phosphate isomerase
MASALMGVKGIDCVVVGADRVAANGDTANKIGTCQLAIAAKYFGIPFFAAVPTTTLDLSMASGAEIHVEERPADEMTRYAEKPCLPASLISSMILKCCTLCISINERSP